jgi:uncharacterized protein YdaU (DUF1376 family)
MTDVIETRGKNKAKMPWFKCYPDAWVRKTRFLSLEGRAVYWDCLCLLYETENPINQDDKWMAHYLHISPRLWRTIRDQLVTTGYLKETPAGLVDDRALEEIEKRSKQRRTNSEIAANRERNVRENSKKRNEINETEARNEHHIENIEVEKKELEDTPEQVIPPLSPPKVCKRGSRLPDDWALPKSWGDWALVNFPQSNAQSIREMADDFADYWRAKAGKDAAKVDWLATWRRWVRSNLRTAPVRGGYARHAVLPSSKPSYEAIFSRADAELMRNARPAD